MSKTTRPSGDRSIETIDQRNVPDEMIQSLVDDLVAMIDCPYCGQPRLVDTRESEADCLGCGGTFKI